MKLNTIIPETIDSQSIINFSKDDSVVVLTLSFDQHFIDCEKLLLAKLVFPAYISIMSAIEIYLKIHFTVFCYLITENIPKYLKIQLEILIEDKSLLNNFQYSVKNKYGHDLIVLITDLEKLIGSTPEETKELLVLKKSIAKLLGREWVSLRYDTQKISSKDKEIEALFDAFKSFKSWMEKNNLDVLNKLIGLNK